MKALRGILSYGNHGLNLEQHYISLRAERKTMDQDHQSPIGAGIKSIKVAD